MSKGPWVLLRNLPSQSDGVFVCFILASQVLTQTLRRPCGSRAFIRLLGKGVDVVTTGGGGLPELEAGSSSG